MNPKAIQNGWVYIEEKHPIINKHFAYKDTDFGRQIMFDDRTFYNENEVTMIQNAGGLKNINVHNIKNVFHGEIISIEKISFL